MEGLFKVQMVKGAFISRFSSMFIQVSFIFVVGFPDAGESCIHLRHMIEFKQSLKLFNLYFRYAPQEPLMKVRLV